MLLGFDTATAAVTVALHDGARVVAESSTVDPMRHGELLAPAIARVLDEAGVDRTRLSRVAVGVGPGPFTGLRVGLVTARTLGAALGIPVVGVCTLDVLAAEVDVDGGGFVVATDARRREVYWARYGSAYNRLTGPAVDRPDAAATSEPVAGRGARLYPDAFPHAIAPEYPSAAAMVTAVSQEKLVPLPPEPLYLRRPDVSEPTGRKRAT